MLSKKMKLEAVKLPRRKFIFRGGDENARYESSRQSHFTPPALQAYFEGLVLLPGFART
jgi:hypothetical protein